MLALSATPGTDVTKVQDVINELHIAHIEVVTAWACRLKVLYSVVFLAAIVGCECDPQIRNDEDPDVQKYTHDKTVSAFRPIVVVPVLVFSAFAMRFGRFTKCRSLSVKNSTTFGTASCTS